MSSTSGKIGGEYGPVRANVDLERLESYLKANVEAIKTPVDVQQFKVRRGLASWFVTKVLIVC